MFPVFKHTLRSSGVVQASGSLQVTSPPQFLLTYRVKCCHKPSSVLFYLLKSNVTARYQLTPGEEKKVTPIFVLLVCWANQHKEVINHIKR